ncbi:gag-pol polyprotein [Salix suchowensis]|nr:gag-pol polyprotein [Salix suchowensis]
MDGNTAANGAPTLNAAAGAVVLPPPAATAPLPRPTTVSLSKPFPDISKIEVFSGENFRRWQERIFGVLDLHGVAWVLADPKDAENAEAWTHGNKVCRHSILNTLSNELFDVYCSYKEAREIWGNMVAKYTAEDVGKHKFVIDIKTQINEYHRLLEDMKAENINLPEAFIAGILIEKPPNSWSDYKQQLKHKHKQLSLIDLITHIIIEDTNRKELQATRKKEITTKANLVEGSPHQKRYDNKFNKNFKSNGNNNITMFKPKTNNFKKKGNCFVCGKPGHHATQCRNRKRNNNPPKTMVNMVEREDIIAAVVSQVNMVTNEKNWVVDSGSTRHICANKEFFSTYTPFKDGEEVVYLGDSRTTNVLGKGKVILKLTSGKTLALMRCCMSLI